MPPDREFDEPTARGVVKRSLKLVADFDSDDIDDFTFERFTPYHKSVFLDAVKVHTNAIMRNETSYYDVKLKQSDMTGKTIGRFIAFLVENRKIAISNKPLTLTETDLKGDD